MIGIPRNTEVRESTVLFVGSDAELAAMLKILKNHDVECFEVVQIEDEDGTWQVVETKTVLSGSMQELVWAEWDIEMKKINEKGTD